MPYWAARQRWSSALGTTRDYLTGWIESGGIRCQLTDTAGIDGGKHGLQTAELQMAAEEHSAEQRRLADVRLLCLDASRSANDWEQSILGHSLSPSDLVVLTKCDLPRALQLSRAVLETSAATGLGMEVLRHKLVTTARSVVGRDDGVIGTAARCYESLRLALESIQRAIELVPTDTGEELIAAEVRTALTEVGKIIGAVYTDDILGILRLF